MSHISTIQGGQFYHVFPERTFYRLYIGMTAMPNQSLVYGAIRYKLQGNLFHILITTFDL